MAPHLGQDNYHNILQILKKHINIRQQTTHASIYIYIYKSLFHQSVFHKTKHVCKWGRHVSTLVLQDDLTVTHNMDSALTHWPALQRALLFLCNVFCVEAIGLIYGPMLPSSGSKRYRHIVTLQSCPFWIECFWIKLMLVTITESIC